MSINPVSRLALTAMLALGVATPVVAQKKGAPAAAAGPQLNFSKEFRVAAQPVQKALQDKDYTAAAAALPAAEAVATTPDDKFFIGNFRYTLGANTKNEAMQNTGVQMMLDSGKASPEQLPGLNLHLGRVAYFAKDYPKAMTYLNEAIRTGSKAPETLILAADINFKNKQYAQGLTYAEQAITAQKALGQPVTEDWYNRALAGAYNLKSDAELVKWGGMLIRAYPTPENWRSILVLYRDAKTREPQVNLDLYRLMRATNSIAGERDFYDYAATASERGLPGEAKAAIDEGMASGKIPASSKILGDLRTSAGSKTGADLASLPAAEKAALAPNGTARQATGTGDGYLSYGQYARAAVLYRAALGRSGVDADAVNTRLGIALARAGDKAGARAAFAAVKGARADLGVLWTVYVDASGA